MSYYKKNVKKYNFALDYWGIKSHLYGNKPNIFQKGAKMTKINKETEMSDLHITSVAIYDVICELMDKNVNPGCIAACLTVHATKLSYATCDDPSLIFENILGAVLEAIPQREPSFSEELEEKITHKSIPALAN